MIPAHLRVEAFFRHAQRSTCVVAKTETAQHITMKAAWLDAYPDSRPLNEKHEVWLPDVKRRPDLVIESKTGQCFSVECQHSTISPDEVHGRMRDHNLDGYPVDFSFSSSRLKSYDLNLTDGVFHAINASDYRSIVIDPQGSASAAWMFFDMHFLNVPQLVKAPRQLKDIALIEIKNRGYSVITPENDTDLLRHRVGTALNNLSGEHTRFLDYFERALNGNFVDPIGMMLTWAQDVKNSETFSIPVEIPKSKYRAYCQTEKQRLEAERRKALKEAWRLQDERLEAERQQRQTEFQQAETLRLAELQQKRAEREAQTAAFNQHLAEALTQSEAEWHAREAKAPKPETRAEQEERELVEFRERAARIIAEAKADNEMLKRRNTSLKA